MTRSATPPLVIESPASELDVVDDAREPSASSSPMHPEGADHEAAEPLPEFLRAFSPSLAPSLLGTVVANLPGQGRVMPGLSFGRVHITAKIEGGFAYTEVDEELSNASDVELEANASFRAPPGGVIARMALWVADRLVEAEVVERQRAAAVYEGVVLRSRRDPALLEQDPSGSLTLRVFPLPAHESRRVVVGYLQPLERREGQYRFELGLRLPENTAPVRDLTAQIELVGVGAEQLGELPDEPVAVVEPSEGGTRVSWAESHLRPLDRHLSFAATQAPLTTFVPAKAKGAERFAAIRVEPDLPSPAPEREASVWLIDTSVGQSGPALDVSKAIVVKLLKQLPPSQRFAILACDTACTSFPRHGLTPATADARGTAQRFVAGLEARGASDIGYALFEALQRTQGRARAQLVYFGDAQPTAGDLDADEMIQRLAARGELLDLRLVGVGTALDADSLSELAARLAAARTSVSADARDADRLGRWLAQPILRAPSLALPSAFESAYPRRLPNLVQGDELLVLARLRRPPSGALRGELSGRFDNGVSLEPRRSESSFDQAARELRADSVPRLWARARLKDLDDDDAPAAYSQSVELSKRYQVLSRHTSLLALESDAMFRTFGIEQQFGRADFGPAPITALPPPKRALPTLMHRVLAPKIRMAASVYVSGRLPPGPIQEVVRSNDGRFRACYHDGLLRNPKLAGTVTTRFVIGRDGSVVTSIGTGGTLTDRAVIDCIVRTFKTLVFPAPDATVVVVYPFSLSPSTVKEQRMLATPWTSREEPPEATLAPAPVPSEPSAPLPRPNAAELAAEVEREPADVEHQLAAAQAYEAERDERRACAHFRAAATLTPLDLDVQYQALRCRARILGERVGVLSDVARLDLHSPAIDALTARIRTLTDIPTFFAAP